jgi:hypothetical protein
MRKMLMIAVLAVMVALAAACGGGGEKAAPVLSDADLKSIVTITSEGLPWQVTPESDSAESNEQASQAFADPSKWLANYEKWGRTGGHVATFTAQAVAVQASAESYTSIDGATEAFSAVRDFAESGEALSVYASQGYAGAKVDKIDAAKVGDDSAAYRLQVTANGQQFDTFVILFRRGAVLAQASVGAATNTSDSSAAGTVANQIDGRIQSLLSSGQP